MMQAPEYEWVCHNCKASNSAGSTACAACGFGARFTLAELAEVQGTMEPVGGSVVDLVLIFLGMAALVGWYMLAKPAWLLYFDVRLLIIVAVLVLLPPYLLLRYVCAVIARALNKRA